MLVDQVGNVGQMLRYEDIILLQVSDMKTFEARYIMPSAKFTANIIPPSILVGEQYAPSAQKTAHRFICVITI